MLMGPDQEASARVFQSLPSECTSVFSVKAIELSCKGHYVSVVVGHFAPSHRTAENLTWKPLKLENIIIIHATVVAGAQCSTESIELYSRIRLRNATSYK